MGTAKASGTAEAVTRSNHSGSTRSLSIPCARDDDPEDAHAVADCRQPLEEEREGDRLALAMAIVLSSCFAAEQNEVANRVNHSRTVRNMQPMGQNLELTLKAQAWAEHLAGIDRLEPSNLSPGTSYRWRSLGGNVGVGSSIASVHQSYLDSSGHRANISSN